MLQDVGTTTWIASLLVFGICAWISLADVSRWRQRLPVQAGVKRLFFWASAAVFVFWVAHSWSNASSVTHSTTTGAVTSIQIALYHGDRQGMIACVEDCKMVPLNFDPDATKAVREYPPGTPFKIGYLPPDLVPELAYVSQSHPGSGRIGLSDGVRPDDSTLGGLSIEAMENITGSETTCSKRVSVQGTTACFRNLHKYADEPGSMVVGRELSFKTPARMVTITIDRSHLAMYSDEDMVKVARSLIFAPSLADYSTWYDARTVLPH